MLSLRRPPRRAPCLGQDAVQNNRRDSWLAPPFLARDWCSVKTDAKKKKERKNHLRKHFYIYLHPKNRDFKKKSQ